MYSLILPYYNQPSMLAKQIETAEQYPEGIETIIIDDGSQTYPASDYLGWTDDANISAYQIHQDIPWNLEGARNLGATVAANDWMIMTDIDHVLPVESALNLINFTPDINKWYRFPRYRIGAADSTRNKDDLPREAKHGKIKTHVNTYLITKAMYWSIGGCDEDYAGVIGGEAPFLSQLKKLYGEATMLPDSICMHVYTRDAVKDANITTLDRDTSKYAELRSHKGDVPAVNPLRFTWSQIV
jgi:glycosyltransferase involved in cell wall biosynthesis